MPDGLRAVPEAASDRTSEPFDQAGWEGGGPIQVVFAVR